MQGCHLYIRTSWDTTSTVHDNRIVPCPEKGHVLSARVADMAATIHVVHVIPPYMLYILYLHTHLHTYSVGVYVCRRLQRHRRPLDQSSSSTQGLIRPVKASRRAAGGGPAGAWPSLDAGVGRAAKGPTRKGEPIFSATRVGRVRRSLDSVRK